MPDCVSVLPLPPPPVLGAAISHPMMVASPTNQEACTSLGNRGNYRWAVNTCFTSFYNGCCLGIVDKSVLPRHRVGS